MEFTSAWNLQCNDFIHKRRPKKHRKLDHCNDEEASVGFYVLMMKLVLMLVLRNRVCLFSVATLISGPAYGAGEVVGYNTQRIFIVIIIVVGVIIINQHLHDHKHQLQERTDLVLEGRVGCQ